MSIYTLAANLGRPCDIDGPSLFEPEVGARAIGMMREPCRLIGGACFDMDAIAVLEQMAMSGSRTACAPLIYGYVSYARAGFRPARISLANIPAAGEGGCVGSVLGGAGIAVSASSANRVQASDFAFWLASGPVRRGPYAAAGGQPGHSDAWRDASVNAPVAEFYRATRATLEEAWVRPRHDGYMPFQQAAAVRLNEGLRSGEPSSAVVEAINASYRASRAQSGQDKQRACR